MLQGRRCALLFLYFILLTVLSQAFIDIVEPVYADPPRDPRVPPARSAPRIETDVTLPRGRIEPGERVTLGLTVSNERGSDAEGYSYEVSLTDGLTLARGGGFLSGSVPRLAAQGVFERTLDVDVAANVVETQYVVLKIYDEEGNLQDSGVVALKGENEEETSIPASPRPWMPGGIEPYTSLFSGAATYNYPLESPPGRGGVQPELAVVYNSRATDATVAWRDSSEWGEGWALAGLPYIYVQNIHVCGHPSANNRLCAGDGDGSDGNGYGGHKRYMLSFGGQTYRIDNDNGALRVTDAPELRITYLFPSSPGWELETPDGLIYHFGINSETRQMMAPVSISPGGEGTDIGKWLLEYVEDSYGNMMAVQYVFKKANGQSGCYLGTCRDVSAYPLYIRYNARNGTPQISDPDDWDSEVAFVWSDLEPDVGLTPIFKTTALIQSVTMSHRGTTGMKTAWSYHFDTTDVSPDPDDCAICEIHQLDSIYRQEGDPATGAANWPKAEFSYDVREMGEWPPDNHCHENMMPPCDPQEDQERFSYPILERVENGYGAVYEFTYAQWGTNGAEYGYTSWTVSDLRVWDGYEREYEVSNDPTLHYAYEYSGICYAEGACNDQMDGEEYGVVGYRETTRQSWEYDEEGTRKRLATDVFEFGTGDDDGGFGHPLLYGRQKEHTRFFDEAAQIPYSVTTWLYDPRIGSTGFESEEDGVGDSCSRYGIAALDGYDMVCLSSVTEELYELNDSGSGSFLVSGKQENFHYEPNRQGDTHPEWRQRGQLTRHDYRYLGGSGAYFNYLLDTYEYQAADWLVRLWKETHYEVIDNEGIPDEWIPQRRTFSLYDDELYPNDGMTEGQLREIRAQAGDDLDGGSAILLDTIDTRFAYDDYGNVTEMARFAGYGRVRWADGSWDTVYVAGNGSAAYTTTFRYDDDLHLLIVGVGDPEGNETLFHYGDPVGSVQPPNALLLSSVDRPTGLITEYQYDAWGRLRVEYGPEVNYPRKSLDYLLPDLDDLEMPIAVTAESYPEADASVNAASRVLYDGLGRVVSRQLLGMTDEVAGGQIDVTTLYGLDGLGRITCESAPLKTSGPNPECTNQGHIATSYDVVGRVTSTIAVDGVEEQVLYIGAEMPGWVEDKNGTLGGSFQVATRVRDESAATTHRRTVKTYDAIGRLAWVGQYEKVSPHVCSQGVRYLITSYEYDYDGRPVSIKRGASLCLQLDGRFALKHLNMVVETTIAYDPQGRKIAMDDPDMGLWRYTYHPDNQVKRQIGAEGTADETVTCAAYDSLGRLTDRWRKNISTAACTNIPPYTSPNAYAHYTYYDTPGRADLGRVKRIDYNVHMPGLSDPYFRDTFTYDELGRPVTVKRRIDGELFTNEVLSYDVLGRPLEVVNAAGITVTTSYDDWGGDQVAAALGGTPTTLVSEVIMNHRGQMSAMVRGNGVVTEYDYFGPAGGYRLDSVDVNAASGGGFVARFDYAYDYVGRIVTAMTEIGGVDSTESFAYDTLGRLDTAGTDAGDPQAYDYRYNYDSLSNLIAVQSGGNTLVAYDMGTPGGDQPHAVKAREMGGGQGPTYELTYDALGQMTDRESEEGVFEQAFDALGRLTSVVHDEEAATYYAYDPDGNRVLAIRPDGRTSYYPFPDYELEAAGWPRTQIVLQPVEVAPSETFTVTWAAYGALLSDCSFSGDWPATPATFSGSQQAQETAQGSYDYVLACANEFGTSVVTRTLTVSAEPAPGNPPPAPPIEMTTRLERTTYGLAGSTVALHRQGQETPSGPYIAELTYMHGNHLGSMTLLTDENGDVVDEARYYPFGGYRQPPTTGMTDIGFTGHRQDNLGWENTGLIYMGARYYEPALRRFVSADAIVPEVPGEAETIAYNRLAYAHQNPVNLIDPTGHCTGRRDQIGNSPEEQACWAKVYTIANMWNDYWAARYGDLETFWKIAGLEVLDTEYWEAMLLAYYDSDASRDAFAAIHSDFDPPPVDWGDYVVLSIAGLPFPAPGFIGAAFTVDEFGNLYVTLLLSSMPGISLMVGEAAISEGEFPDGLTPLESLPKGEQEAMLREALEGWGLSVGAGLHLGLAGAISLEGQPHIRVEGGFFYKLGLAGSIGYSFRIASFAIPQ